MPEDNKNLEEELKNDETLIQEVVNPENEQEEFGRTVPKQKVLKVKNTSYRYTKMSNFVLRLSKFYSLTSFWKLALITAGLAVLFGFIGIFFVKNPGIYNFGLAAFGQAVSRITITALRKNPNITPSIFNAIDHSLFWVLYLALSIPIFVFGWKKLGKNFMILTIEFLFISSLVSFALGQIPQLNNFYLFGKFNHPEITENMKDALVSDAGWTKGNEDSLLKLLPLLWNDGGNIIAQMVFAIIYGILLSYFFAILAIIGGSAGVTGIISEYTSTVKQKNFAKISGLINIIVMVISVLIGTYIPGSMIAKDFSELKTNLTEESRNACKIISESAWNFELYFAPNFVSTFLCNFVFMLYLNNLFPRFKIVQCKVYTYKIDAVRDAIVNDGRTINSFTVQNGQGGYSGSKLKILSSITLYRQVPKLIKIIRTVDTEALITINNIASVDGGIYMPKGKF